MYSHNVSILRLALSTASLLLVSLTQNALAQSEIVPDDTLAAESSRVRTVDSQTQYIEGGQVSGSHVLHSFLEFNVDSGQSVFFWPGMSIQHVLSRVTGNNQSNILGTLGVIGEANLWLINPNGIIFGPDAALDIQQSFYAATTLDLLAETFQELSSPNPPLLDLGPEISFFNYLSSSATGIVPGDVLVQGELSVGQNLTLSGQTLQSAAPLEAGNRLLLLAQDDITTAGKLNALGGEILLLSLAGQISVCERDTTDADGGGTIRLTAMGDIVTNGVYAQAASGQREVGNGGEITLLSTNGNILNLGPVNASTFSGVGNAGNGGSLTLVTHNGNITNQDHLDTRAHANSSGNAGNGGPITLFSTEGDITNYGRLSSRSFSNLGNAGTGGAISLTSTVGDIRNHDILQSVSITRQDGGDSSTGGAIHLTTTSGEIISQARIQSSSVAFSGNAGDGGDISLSSTEGRITLQDEIISNSFSVSNRAGDGGRIEISSVDGSIFQSQDFKSNSASNEGRAGNGGNISLTSTYGDLVLSGDFISNSNAPRENRNRGGDILLVAENGQILGESSDGAPINLFSFTISEEGLPTGEGGDITLMASDRISGLTLYTLSNSGTAGDIVIEGDNLVIQNTQLIPTGQSQIPNRFDLQTIRTVVLSETGQPGNVEITSLGNLTLENVIILSDANQGEGGIGAVTLSSGSAMELVNSQILTNTNSADNGGDMTLSSPRRITLDRTDLTTSTSGSGLAGNFLINAGRSFLLRNNSSLLADAGGNADGGDIDINADFVIASLDENNNIIANAEQGNGGEITINATGVYGFVERQGLTTNELRGNTTNDISASSRTGTDGNITVNALDRFLTTEPETLDQTFLYSDDLISNSCIDHNRPGEGRFTIEIGQSPNSLRSSTVSNYSLGNVQLLPEQTQSTEHNWQLGKPIIEAESIARLADGQIAFRHNCYGQ